MLVGLVATQIKDSLTVSDVEQNRTGHTTEAGGFIPAGATCKAVALRMNCWRAKLRLLRMKYLTAASAVPVQTD